MQKMYLSLVLLLVCAVVGCGRRDGLTRYAIYGTVTYDGKPLAEGRVRFTPDSDQGNRGPASMIDVVDGRYRSIDGYGVLGGAYTVEIRELGPSPTIPPYTLKIELPKKDSVQDFEIPRK